jgi:hypothetical protein
MTDRVEHYLFVRWVRQSHSATARRKHGYRFQLRWHWHPLIRAIDIREPIQCGTGSAKSFVKSFENRLICCTLSFLLWEQLVLGGTNMSFRWHSHSTLALP